MSDDENIDHPRSFFPHFCLHLPNIRISFTIKEHLTYLYLKQIIIKFDCINYNSDLFCCIF